MRRYEMGLVVSPTVPENEHDRLITSLETLISDRGGQVLKVDRWGRRKLAYPIRKFTEGNMTFLLFDAEADVEQEIVRRIKLSDHFLRHLSVRADHEKPPTDEEKVALEEQRKEILRKAEERAKAEAEAAARGETLPDDYDPDAVDEDSDDEDGESRRESRDEDAGDRREAAPTATPASSGGSESAGAASESKPEAASESGTAPESGTASESGVASEAETPSAAEVESESSAGSETAKQGEDEAESAKDTEASEQGDEEDKR